MSAWGDQGTHVCRTNCAVVQQRAGDGFQRGPMPVEQLVGFREQPPVVHRGDRVVPVQYPQRVCGAYVVVRTFVPRGGVPGVEARLLDLAQGGGSGWPTEAVAFLGSDSFRECRGARFRPRTDRQRVLFPLARGRVDVRKPTSSQGRFPRG
jgi:hypothetical protein